MLSYSGRITRRLGSSENTMMLGKTKGCRESGRPTVRWMTPWRSHSMSVQELGRAVEDGTSWASFIHRVARSGSWFTGTWHIRKYVLWNPDQTDLSKYSALFKFKLSKGQPKKLNPQYTALALRSGLSGLTFLLSSLAPTTLLAS